MCKYKKRGAAFNGKYTTTSVQRDGDRIWQENLSPVYLCDREYLTITAKRRSRKFLAAARRRRKRGGYGNGADHYRGAPALHRETAGYKMIRR